MCFSCYPNDVDTQVFLKHFYSFVILNKRYLLLTEVDIKQYQQLSWYYANAFYHAYNKEVNHWRGFYESFHIIKPL